MIVHAIYSAAILIKDRHHVCSCLAEKISEMHDVGFEVTSEMVALFHPFFQI